LSAAAQADFERNQREYSGYWTFRLRRRFSYSTQTKLKRFRHFAKQTGLLDLKDLSVFDQGFGLGRMLLMFQPSCSIAGTELSLEAVERAKEEAAQKGFKNIDFQVYTPGMNYPERWHGSFDLVISSHVLEHLQKPASALCELVSLLKPEGRALLIVPVNEKQGDDLNHFSCFTEQSFLGLVRDARLIPLMVCSCDKLWDVLAPFAARQQRNPAWWLRPLSIMLNLTTGLLPHWALRLSDEILGICGCKDRQCFVFCSRDYPPRAARNYGKGEG
jgi:2-polyprenyl-3-methyl-5-hydroxy-6-metoxy-1,4-benzoquinol methylase